MGPVEHFTKVKLLGSLNARHLVPVRKPPKLHATVHCFFT